MKPNKSGLDPAFVEKQRQRLLSLRVSLVGAVQSAESEETALRTERTDGPLELEEDAQELDALERDDNVVVRHVGTLERIDRALQKIEEGTYGLSEMSGEPIPRERLEAVPEALYTLSEESLRERPR